MRTDGGSPIRVVGVVADVTPTDPGTVAAIALALLLVGSLAALWAARRAAMVDPVQVPSGD